MVFLNKLNEIYARHDTRYLYQLIREKNQRKQWAIFLEAWHKFGTTADATSRKALAMGAQR